MRSRMDQQFGHARKAVSEEAFGVLIDAAPSAQLRPQSSVSWRTLGYLFDSYTKTALLPFGPGCCVDRLNPPFKSGRSLTGRQIVDRPSYRPPGTAEISCQYTTFVGK